MIRGNCPNHAPPGEGLQEPADLILPDIQHPGEVPHPRRLKGGTIDYRPDPAPHSL